MSLLSSYPWRGRGSRSERISSSALPFLRSVLVMPCSNRSPNNISRGDRWGSRPDRGPGRRIPAPARSAGVRELEGPRPLLKDEAVHDQPEEKGAGREPAGSAARGQRRERVPHRQVEEGGEKEGLVRVSEAGGEERPAEEDEAVGRQPGGDQRPLLPAQQEEDEPHGREHEG